MSGYSYKVLALDVDGVLNETPRQIGSLMPDKVALLREIVERTGCFILIISSWRRFPLKMEQITKVVGSLTVYSILPFHDAAAGSFAMCSTKADDLRRWFKDYSPPGMPMRLVVLDDEKLDGFEEEQVQTVSEIGLTREVVEEVVRRFKREGGV